MCNKLFTYACIRIAQHILYFMIFENTLAIDYYPILQMLIVCLIIEIITLLCYIKINYFKEQGKCKA